MAPWASARLAVGGKLTGTGPPVVRAEVPCRGATLRAPVLSTDDRGVKDPQPLAMCRHAQPTVAGHALFMPRLQMQDRRRVTARGSSGSPVRCLNTEHRCQTV